MFLSFSLNSLTVYSSQKETNKRALESLMKVKLTKGHPRDGPNKTRTTYIGAGDGADQGRFTVSDVTNRADIDCRLSGDNFWVQGRDLGHIEVIQGLRRQMILTEHVFLLIGDDLLFSKFFEDEGLLRRPSCL